MSDFSSVFCLRRQKTYKVDLSSISEHEADAHDRNENVSTPV